ncbi:SDR family NAD(P)-dependent oxidoreductase [Leptolyngbya sp. NIES-2104]|uniref:SDR family NAD(P)-dependent oxidoreductase n=1 Tax=Leptolyngbya sp. NIES-2104 TaxID=1552121 RepID=UPI0006ECA8D9|nr:SDR family NAD(P)-dependent oxidoreductase [Leptolyngbya sp. NIES-2104]GAP97984.1 short-chain dehydrogenase/reductase SDR [Leptolyngbya sp. NIES-2104]
MTSRLANQVAIVTGASSGIGEATAIALAVAGVKVALAARRVDRLTTLSQQIQDQGGTVMAIETDIADEVQVRNLVQKVQTNWGQIDILINNAGVMLLGPIDGADTEDWRRMINVNVLGLMYATHAVLPVMKAQKSGHILNISSVAGRVVQPYGAVYCATKFAVGAFSESLRQQVSSDNIRVTIVEPGVVATELVQHITHAETKDMAETFYGSMKTLDSEDIASAIVYALTQPAHVNVNELLIRPTQQER